MRATSTLLRLAICLSSLTSLGLASVPDANPALVVRQDDESRTDDSSRSTITDPPSTESEDSSRSTTTGDRDEDRTTANDDDDEETQTGSRTGTAGRSSGSSSPTRTRFPPDAPAGGVTLISPVTLVEPTPLYKISDHVTFSWNYTSLRGTPTAVDVLVSCAEASRTWTLAPNMTFETDVAFVWDTQEDADDAEAGGLLTELYTLIVKDADAEITDSPEPGYLGAYTGFTFGLYAGIPYTPYPQWNCPGCSAGTSLLDRQAVGFALTMGLITVLSFTWFIGGLGLN